MNDYESIVKPQVVTVTRLLIDPKDIDSKTAYGITSRNEMNQDESLKDKEGIVKPNYS